MTWNNLGIVELDTDGFISYGSWQYKDAGWPMNHPTTLVCDTLCATYSRQNAEIYYQPSCFDDRDFSYPIQARGFQATKSSCQEWNIRWGVFT